MLASATAVFAQTSTPTLSFTSTGNTPYSTLTLSGQGFQPGESVLLMFGLNSTTTTADESGAFGGAMLTVPNVPSGLYLIIAVGQSSGLPAFSYMWLNQFYPLVSPSGWYVPPGSTLTFSGSGFAPGEQITVRRGDTEVAQFNANASGAFSTMGSTTVPFSARNSAITYNVRGAGSGVNTNLVISVADLYPYATPSSWYIRPGSDITFSGAGFGMGETVSVYLGADTTPVISGIATAGGAFTSSATTTIPYGITSPAQYRVVGDQSGAVATVPITLAAFYPSIVPSAYYSGPGSSISLTGTGFAPGEQVVVAAGTASTTAAADSMGNFSIPSLVLPPAPNTMQTVSATGAQSGAMASFVMAIGDYYSWGTLSTYWAQGGSPLTVFGHNFASGEQVTLSAGGSTFATTTADSMGDFTAAAQVPYLEPGETTIVAKGGSSGTVANMQMTIAPVYVDFQLGSYAVTAGTPIRFLGSGYLPGESVEIRTSRTSESVVHTIAADGSGSFDDSAYIIPADFAEGMMTVSAHGVHSWSDRDIELWVGAAAPAATSTP